MGDWVPVEERSGASGWMGIYFPTFGPTTRAWGPCKSLGLLFAEEASSRDLLIGHSLALELAKVLALELSPSPLQPWSPIQPCGACGAWAPANFLPNCSSPDERPPPPSQWIHFNPRETRAISAEAFHGGFGGRGAVVSFLWSEKGLLAPQAPAGHLTFLQTQASPNPYCIPS